MHRLTNSNCLHRIIILCMLQVVQAIKQKFGQWRKDRLLKTSLKVGNYYGITIPLYYIQNVVIVKTAPLQFFLTGNFDISQ